MNENTKEVLELLILGFVICFIFFHIKGCVVGTSLNGPKAEGVKIENKGVPRQ